MQMESVQAAQELVDQIKKKYGFDYEEHIDEIASQLFDTGIFNGNWDVATDLRSENLRELRAIQEDEYDQNPDEDIPGSKDLICLVRSASAYVWFV